MPDKRPLVLKFPDNFLWGCSTSAHQIEGGLINDWSEWEKSPGRLAELKRKQLDPLDFISGMAANTYEDNNADIDCLKRLGANVYRFSLDWSRIEPREGEFNEEALAYYRNFVLKLKAKGIEPFITLWHWPVPLWVRDRGGWENRDTASLFRNYVKRAVAYLDHEVNFWITLNEPMVYVSQSYITGEWPPQKRSRLKAWRVINNLVKAHRLAYQTIKQINSDNQVGVSKNNIFFEPAGGQPINKALKVLVDWWWNYRFLNKIRNVQDFIGLNYYFHSLVDKGFNRQYSYTKNSDLGWGLHPEGIYEVLQGLKRYQKPIYITENGLADSGDRHREWYISEIIKNMHRAISEGVDLRGYMHWSLIDNFEWAYGFKPRFGLFEVNYQNYERQARASAHFYAEICRRNGI